MLKGGEGFGIGVEVFVSCDLQPLEFIESFVAMLSRFSDPTRETRGVVERFGFGMIDGLMKLFSKIID